MRFWRKISSANFRTSIHFLRASPFTVGHDSSVGIATRYGLYGPGIESWWGERFSAWTLGPTPVKWVRGVLPGVKLTGHGVNHWPLSSAEVEERVELYLYFRAFMTCSRTKFIFTSSFKKHFVWFKNANHKYETRKSRIFIQFHNYKGCSFNHSFIHYTYHTGWSKSLCARDDYNTETGAQRFLITLYLLSIHTRSVNQ